MEGYYENRKYKDNFALSIFETENLTFRSHWHTDIELVYVISGTITLGINGERRILGVGEFAIVGSGDIHDYQTIENQSSLCYLLIFHPSVIEKHLDAKYRLKFDGAFFRDKEKGVASKLMLIIQEMKKEQELFEMNITGLLMVLFSEMIRDYGSSQVLNKSKSLIISKNAIDYIEKNFKHELSLEEVADAVNLNRYYFCKLFNKVTGMHFGDYVNSVRIEYCEKEIVNSRRSITEVALESGFGSIRTFNRVFLKYRGYKPSDLRYRY